MSLGREYEDGRLVASTLLAHGLLDRSGNKRRNQYVGPHVHPGDLGSGQETHLVLYIFLIMYMRLIENKLFHEWQNQWWWWWWWRWWWNIHYYNDHDKHGDKDSNTNYDNKIMVTITITITIWQRKDDTHYPSPSPPISSVNRWWSTYQTIPNWTSLLQFKRSPSSIDFDK